jgi:hypothetical protein
MDVHSFYTFRESSGFELERGIRGPVPVFVVAGPPDR